MSRYMVDQEALISYLRKNLNECLKAEEKFGNGKNYEEAVQYRERRYVLGNLLLMIIGDAYHDPVTIEDGGFMKKMTNIRAAVNDMTDLELAEVLPTYYTIIDGKLSDCDGSMCTKCPIFEIGVSCNDSVREYMMQEADA